MLLYRLLRFLLRLAVGIFYKEVQVVGKEHLPTQGPLIVAVNHPNTVMDPIVVALQLKQRTGFLANAGIFANALLKWIFAKLHLIPVYRQQDVKAGEVADNRSSFKKCYDYLLRGGTLMIFPEGSSVNEMKLRKLKTGTARIALETAELTGFSSGLMLNTVSLTYSDPIRFRSRLYIRIDKPIAIDAYATAYRQEPATAVQQLTEEMRERLQKNLIVTSSKEQEDLLRQIKKLYGDHLRTSIDQPISQAETFEIQQQIAEGFLYYQNNRPEEYNALAGRIHQYFSDVAAADLKEGFLSASMSLYKKMLMLVGNTLMLLLGFPLYLLGLLTNYLPYMLPARIAKALGTDIEYRAGIMMISGMFLFPLYYAFILFLVAGQTSLLLYVLIPAGLMLMPALGFFTLFYWRTFLTSKSLLRYLSIRFSKADKLQFLKKERQVLIQALEQAALVLSASAEQRGTAQKQEHG